MSHCQVEDQPKPTGDGQIVFTRFLNIFINNADCSTEIQAQILHDIVDRAVLGRSRYGTFLRTDNGRDAVVDGYQELLDLSVYLTQVLFEAGEPDKKSVIRNMLRNCVDMLVEFRDKLL